MKIITPVAMAALVLFAAGTVWAQTPPPGPGPGQPPEGGEGGIKTSDMDPYQTGKSGQNLAAALPVVLKQAEGAVKKIKSHSAKFSFHLMDQQNGKDERFQGSLKAKQMKGRKMWMAWDAGKAANPTWEQVIGEKILYKWIRDKEWDKVDYKKQKKDPDYPAELFFLEHFKPSALKKTFTFELKNLASKFNEKGAAKDEKPPVDDPFANKAKEFENSGNSGGASNGNTPSPDTHHIFLLTPKDKKLAAKIYRVRAFVHYKTAVIPMLEIVFDAGGSKKITITLSDIKLNPEIEDKVVEADTSGYKKK